MPAIRRLFAAAGAFLVVANLAWSAAAAQEAPARAAKIITAAVPNPPLVTPAQARTLVRATLLSLSDANQSGNYSVLRDLACPEFRERHTVADLASRFADLRRQQPDLAAIVTINPQFTDPVAIDDSQALRLKGLFATEPLRTSFDLGYKQVGQHWRLSSIAVGLNPKLPVKARQAQKRPRAPDRIWSLPSFFD